jgi:L,D-peptidoglycan transpeptidase YkuD (ErfK/YbiS/YcfS/YnhG family)
MPVGVGVPADIGRNGMSAHITEGAQATPIGSFTMTQAFGRDADPGTALPYFQTTPADWWISEPGALYNTHQNCASNCPFDTAAGNPNEHLYYETPFYNYAVVIDYNTANAGPVVQGAGSAFFLHVTNDKPSLGCVAIPTDSLLPLMRWLNPADHPRILIGVS